MNVSNTYLVVKEPTLRADSSFIAISKIESLLQKPEPASRTFNSETEASSTTPSDSPAAAAFLNIADDEDSFEPIGVTIKTNVQQQVEIMLKTAKKHKSAMALFKLHTLKQYLDL
jgi:hypothetical protein